MRLSDLFQQLNAAGNVASFTTYLAAPDKDGTDVDLASVARVEVDDAKGAVRFYPASTATDSDPNDPEPSLEAVLSQLPMDAVGENDLQLLAEIPLLRDDAGANQVGLVDISSVRIGQSSQEIWFLVQPERDFPADVLPT